MINSTGVCLWFSFYYSDWMLDFCFYHILLDRGEKILDQTWDKRITSYSVSHKKHPCKTRHPKKQNGWHCEGWLMKRVLKQIKDWASLWLLLPFSERYPKLNGIWTIACRANLSGLLLPISHLGVGKGFLLRWNHCPEKKDCLQDDNWIVYGSAPHITTRYSLKITAWIITKRGKS